MTDPTPQPTPPETVLHPDDGVSLLPVAVFPGTSIDTSERLYRVDKIELNGGGGARTQYSFRRAPHDDTEQVLVEVAHGETSKDGDKPPASIADLTVSRKVGDELRSLHGPTEEPSPKLDRPQTWYTYKDTDSGEAFSVVIYPLG